MAQRFDVDHQLDQVTSATDISTNTTATLGVAGAPASYPNVGSKQDKPTPIGPLGVRPLTPTFIENEHTDTVQTLLDLTPERASKDYLVRNVAVAGPYGSGKSSVLLEMRKRLGRRAINISLSSLSTIDPDLDVAADRQGLPLPTTNFIQKEVIKQILYRELPGDFPESRYSRTYGRGNGPEIATSAAVVAVFVLVAGLVGLPSAIGTTFFDQNIRPAWAAICIMAFVSAAATYSIVGTLKRRFSIQSVTAGPAAITLEGRNTYYFDEYLDEIVYYFEESSTDVVIFEDIDRFDDTHIFESLRNLSLVLNNSKQVGRPIYFIYAIRDSIFASDQTSRGQRTAVDSIGSRTKFFDAIVPLVPFITHRTARDLLEQELTDVPEKPNGAVVTSVAEHVSDMRLLRNIVNEYRIFAKALLGPGKLVDLTPETLFVMISYKNLKPDDFESIRNGNSSLDYLQEQLNALAQRRIKDIDKETAELIESHEELDPSDTVLQARVEALLVRVDALTTALWGTSYLNSFLVDGETFSSSIRERPALCTALLKATGAEFGGLSLDKGQMETLAGGPLTTDEVRKAAGRKINERLEKLGAERTLLRRSNFADLVTADAQFSTIQGEQSASSIARTILGTHADLWIRMMTSGHLDQNYALYTARYYGTTLSADGLTFVIRNIQRNNADFERTFTRPPDIQTIIDERDDSFFEQDAALNLQIVAHAVATEHRGLKRMAERLARADEMSRLFLSAYARSTTTPVLWHLVSSAWPASVDFLAEEDGIDARRLAILLSESIQKSITLHVSDAGARLVQKMANNLTVLNVKTTPQEARRVARHLASFGARIQELETLDSPLRSSIVETKAFAISRSNLLIATDSEGIMSLDTIKQRDEKLYRHVLSDLSSYLESRESSDPAVISEASQLGDIINDACQVSPNTIGRLVRALDPEDTVSDLVSLAHPAREALFSTGHASVTAHNLAAVLADNTSLPDSVLGTLESEQVFHDEAPTGDTSLAATIANTIGLSPQARAHLVNSMDVALPLDDITAADVLGPLVEIGALSDDYESANRAMQLGTRAWVEFVSVSQEWESIVSYVDSPSADMLEALVLSDQVAPASLAAVAEQLPNWPNATDKVGPLIAQRCASDPQTKLTAASLAWLSAHGAGVADVATLLARAVDELSPALIYSVTDSMGPGYEKLSSPRGWTLLPNTPSTNRILERLRADIGFVSSWSDEGEEIRVNFTN